MSDFFLCKAICSNEESTPCEDKWPAKKCNTQKNKNRCDKMRVIEYCQKTCGYCEGKLINSKTAMIKTFG